MADTSGFERARTVSVDFDGVLSGLVLGRTWEKARARKKRASFLSPAVRVVKNGMAALTEGLRKPLPHAGEALRGIRSSQRTLFLLTSRTGPRIAAAGRWLERYLGAGLFERLFFNTEGEDADRFKARILASQPIDVHIDDDPETLALLAGEFPDRLFVHLNRYRRKSPRAGNIVVVAGWEEVAALFAAPRSGPRQD
jgi:hypothetical protein